MAEKSIYIKVLEYGENHPQGFVFQKIKDDLNLSEDETKLLQAEIPTGRILTYVRQLPQEQAVRGDIHLMMLTFEGRSKLLEYRELQATSESARIALIIAIISIILTFLSIIVPFFNTTEVQLNKKQADSFIEAIKSY